MNNIIKGNIIVISGFSGVGKSTIVRKLVNKYNNYCLSVSVTTRNKRKSEVDSKDYFFVDKSKFEHMIKNNEFLEYAKYLDNYYGTPINFVKDKLKEDKNVILEIDVNGALDVKRKFNSAILIFILPPSIKELKNRLKIRSSNSDMDIKNRLNISKDLEFINKGKYDYLLVNDNIDYVIEEINNISKGQYNNIQIIKKINNLGKVFNSKLKELKNETKKINIPLEVLENIIEKINISSNDIKNIKKEANIPLEVYKDMVKTFNILLEKLNNEIKEFNIFSKEFEKEINKSNISLEETENIIKTANILLEESKDKAKRDSVSSKLYEITDKAVDIPHKLAKKAAELFEDPLKEFKSILKNFNNSLKGYNNIIKVINDPLKEFNNKINSIVQVMAISCSFNDKIKNVVKNISKELNIPLQEYDKIPFIMKVYSSEVEIRSIKKELNDIEKQFNDINNKYTDFNNKLKNEFKEF